METYVKNFKSKVYFIHFPEHAKYARIFNNDKAQEKLKNIGMEISAETDLLKLGKEIAQSDYHGYSSLIFFVEVLTDEDSCYDKLFAFIIECILMNPTLKYVAKVLVHSIWVILYDGEHAERNFEKFRLKLSANSWKHQSLDATIDDLDNAIMLKLIEISRPVKTIFKRLEDFVESIVCSFQTTSIQELIIAPRNYDPNPPYARGQYSDYETMSKVECYIFNINPAIACIINHQTFFNDEFDIRKSSQKDIEALQRAFLSKKIPCLTIYDGSSEDVRAIMQKVRTAKFKGIKDMYIVVMSHGDEGDIIYTKTGSYNIRDTIVTPVKDNPTLANTQKFVIVNACRGTFNPIYDDNEQLEEIQKKLSSTIIYPQDKNLMMIFSTQIGYISNRFKDGCIFIQKFCQPFGAYFSEKSMEAICQETTKNMERELGDNQIPDFQIDEQRPHTIKMEFTNFFHIQEFLNEVFTDNNKKCTAEGKGSAKADHSFIIASICCVIILLFLFILLGLFLC